MSNAEIMVDSIHCGYDDRRRTRGHCLERAGSGAECAGQRPGDPPSRARDAEREAERPLHAGPARLARGRRGGGHRFDLPLPGSPGSPPTLEFPDLWRCGRGLSIGHGPGGRLPSAGRPVGADHADRWSPGSGGRAGLVGDGDAPGGDRDGVGGGGSHPPSGGGRGVGPARRPGGLSLLDGSFALRWGERPARAPDGRGSGTVGGDGRPRYAARRQPPGRGGLLGGDRAVRGAGRGDPCQSPGPSPVRDSSPTG